MNVLDRVDAAHQRVLQAIPEDFLDLTDIEGTRKRFDEVAERLRKPERPAGLRIDDHHAIGVRRPRGARAPLPARRAADPGAGALLDPRRRAWCWAASPTTTTTASARPAT